MKASDITHPKHVRATCVECEQQRTFSVVGGNVEKRIVRYGCEACDHEVWLGLDPENTP